MLDRILGSVDAMIFGIAVAGVLAILKEVKSNWSNMPTVQKGSSLFVLTFLVCVLLLKLSFLF